MGFLDKVKNMFTEEVEVEETPIKKDVIQVEIPAPVKEEKKEETVVTERKEKKKEDKPSTPVFFDDKDFASLERIEGLERLDTSQATTMKLMFAFTKVAELKGID